jgi:hypothetical protein
MEMSGEQEMSREIMGWVRMERSDRVWGRREMEISGELNGEVRTEGNGDKWGAGGVWPRDAE